MFALDDYLKVFLKKIFFPANLFVTYMGLIFKCKSLRLARMIIEEIWDEVILFFAE